MDQGGKSRILWYFNLKWKACENLRREWKAYHNYGLSLSFPLQGKSADGMCFKSNSFKCLMMSDNFPGSHQTSSNTLHVVQLSNGIAYLFIYLSVCFSRIHCLATFHFWPCYQFRMFLVLPSESCMSGSTTFSFRKSLSSTFRITSPDLSLQRLYLLTK